MAQYNAKIDDGLKESLDVLQAESGIEKKEEFLRALADAFRMKQAQEAAPGLDRYRHITGAAKRSIAESFEFIAGQLDAALGQLAQRERQIAQEREELATKIAAVEEAAAKREKELIGQVEEAAKRIVALEEELAISVARIEELEEQAEAAKLADKLAEMVHAMAKNEK